MDCSVSVDCCVSLNCCVSLLLCFSELLCFSGARQDSDPPSILSLLSWSSRQALPSHRQNTIAWHFWQLCERIRLCRRESPLLGLLRVLSSASSSPQVTRRLYILPRVLPILIFDHSLLNILSVNFLSIFASTCYIITFCSKHVDISFCILSTHFLSDKENIFMNFKQYILSFTVKVV